MKKYEEPKMKLHELKTGRVMLPESVASGKPQGQGGIDQLQNSNVWENDDY